MGMFEGMNVNQYRSSRGGNYFQEGDYACRVLSMKVIKKRDNHTAFVAEYEVLESNNEDIKVGSKRSIFIKMSDAQYQETAMGNVADAMRAGLASMMYLHGEASAEIPKIDKVNVSDDDADQIIGEEQPLAGAIVGVRAYQITTRAGNPFTKHDFFIPENARELFAAP